MDEGLIFYKGVGRVIAQSKTLVNAGAWAKKVMKPYKKWRDKLFQSVPIVVESGLYYVVCTLKDDDFDRMIVVTDGGKLVSDEVLVRKVFGAFLDLQVGETTLETITMDSTHNARGEFNMIRDASHALLQYVDGEEALAVVQEQIAYYDEMIETFNALSKQAKACVLVVQDVLALDGEPVNDLLRRKLENELMARGKLRSELEYLLISHDHDAIIDLLADFRGEPFAESILEEASGAREIAGSTLLRGEEYDWPFYTLTLNPELGKFTPDKFVEFLRKENEYDLLRRANVNVMIHNKWPVG